MALSTEDKIRILDQGATPAQREQCGWNRHKRQCLECRFQSGQFRYHLFGKYASGPNLGSSTTPVVRTRATIVAYDAVEWFFSGLWDGLENRRPATDQPVTDLPVFESYGGRSTAEGWNHYMVRCTVCERWQGIGAFRYAYRCNITISPPRRYISGAIGQEVLDVKTLSCHRCFLRLYGRDKFQKALLEWWDNVVNLDVDVSRHQISHGWVCLWRNPKGIPQKIRDDVVTQVLTGLPYVEKSAGYIRDDLDLESADLDMIKERYLRLVALLGSIEADLKFLVGFRWFKVWAERYDDLEIHWRWLANVNKEVHARPEILIDWALSKPPCSTAWPR